MITRERIIIVAVLVAVIAGFGAAYVFYFQGKMEAYGNNKRFMDDLDRNYAELSGTFSGYEPDALIALWKQQVQPWADNRNELATYYHLSNWREAELPPADVAIPKFWYEEQAKKTEQEFYQYLFEKMGDYRNRFPTDIRTTFNVKRLEDWQGVDVNDRQVQNELRKLNFGINVSKFLIENKVWSVKSLRVWPDRKVQNTGNMLNYVTLGMEITMTLENFVKFMDNLRTAPRYFTVEAVTVSYPYIMYQEEPYLDIKLLITQSAYVGPKTVEQAGNANAAAVFNNTAMTNRQGIAQPPAAPSFMDKAWKWFKNNVLVMN